MTNVDRCHMLIWVLSQLVIRLVRIRVVCREHLSADNAPVVVAANHIGWIDPFAIIAALGPMRPVVFLAAREHVEKRRLLDWLLGRLGAVIKVERTSLRQREVLRAAEARITGGASTALFPEGRINVIATTGRPLLPFEPGAAVIARRSNVPIVPMAIAGSDDLYFGRRIRIAIGPPITPGPNHRTDETTTTCLRDTILTLIPPTPPHNRVRIGKWLGRLV
jgi:1-acyl-sn-glycerol-3-phosphate acyltransferase